MLVNRVSLQLRAWIQCCVCVFVPRTAVLRIYSLACIDAGTALKTCYPTTIESNFQPISTPYFQAVRSSHPANPCKGCTRSSARRKPKPYEETKTTDVPHPDDPPWRPLQARNHYPRLAFPATRRDPVGSIDRINGPSTGRYSMVASCP
ncbi:hypothetical protein BO94DRAFT_117720 [Aspergillus sclerotioniger CBS 115572]|uniref:Uncharacterized protein n=1 Tax=Aspergillus sclerotioniger CBS 115572 TaxID=1450535 RepID=A0A317W9P2_9EURO|nr:hypothetical protein BO94DRAFT_117720 [Aspergillus sclerotioniger CBS 115572]PWY83073.1 hypothetical protein BO94DRAFT_117720 [Aspergillus sclerotioniger CBS 115572]